MLKRIHEGSMEAERPRVRQILEERKNGVTIVERERCLIKLAPSFLQFQAGKADEAMHSLGISLRVFVWGQFIASHQL